VLRDWAQTVEGLGFDLLMVSDHVVVTPGCAEQLSGPFYEPFTTLSWLAGVTAGAAGTTVLIAQYRHPLLVARNRGPTSTSSVGAGWCSGGGELGAAGSRGAGRAVRARGRDRRALRAIRPPGRRGGTR